MWTGDVRFLLKQLPTSALVLAMREVVPEQRAPSSILLSKLALVAFVMLGVGLVVFGRLKKRLYLFTGLKAF